MTEILAALLAATIQLTGLQANPQFEEMTTDQMKADGCVHPETCQTLISIHPPMTDRIIVNTDIDLAHDVNAQGQVVHVLAMYMLEKKGTYSPDMPCSKVMGLEAQADIIQRAYLEIMSNQYHAAGLTPPPESHPQVVTFCTPDEMEDSI